MQHGSKKFSVWAVTMAMLLFCPSLLFALPQEIQDQSNPATFGTSADGLTMEINTNADRSILNYSSFNIAQNETVNINQPSAGSVSLNRVVGASPSSIFGSLLSNGRVFLVNPNGILFAPGSHVNAAGLIASTMDIADENFLNGDYNFFKNADNAFLKNDGTITVRNGGYVCLLSQAVENTGSIAIEAGTGSIALAVGERMTLNLDDAGDISVVIDEAVSSQVMDLNGNKVDSAVKNIGKLTANGGKVLLTSRVLNGVFDHAINNAGVIEANSAVEHNGVIELVAEGGAVANIGKIAADGSPELPNGGEVRIVADSIEQRGVISANALEGGTAGVVTLEAEDSVVLKSGSAAQASAVGLSGNGGRVNVSGREVVAEKDAVVDVSGGTNEGNAGIAYLDGSERLAFYGKLDGRAAPGGVSGLFLFGNDPTQPQPSVTTDKLDYDPIDTPVITGTGFAPNAEITLNISNPAGDQDTVTVTTDAQGDFSYTYAPGGLSHGVYATTATDGLRSAATAFTDANSVMVVIGKPTPGTIPSSTSGGFDLTISLPLSVPSNKPGQSYQTVSAIQIIFNPPHEGEDNVGPVNGSSWGDPEFIGFTGTGLSGWTQGTPAMTISLGQTTLFITTTSVSGGLSNGVTGNLQFNITTPTLYGNGGWNSLWSLRAWHNVPLQGTNVADFSTNINLDLTPAYLSIETAANGTGVHFGGFTLPIGNMTDYAYAIARAETTDDFIANVNADWSVVDPAHDPSTLGTVSPVSGPSTRFTGEHAGTVQLKAVSGEVSVGDNTDYSGNITMPSMLVTVAADPQSKIYGDSDPALTYQITSGSLLPGDDFAGALSRALGDDVGTYAIGQGTLSLGCDYTLTFVGADFLVTPKGLTITALDQTKTYGSAFTFTGTEFTSNGLVSGDSITGVTLTSAGAANTANVTGSPYDIVASNAVGTGLSNYDITYNDGALTVNKADATINVTGYVGTYDGDAHGATGSATGVLGEALSGLDLGASFANVPGGMADWAFTDVTGNYNDDSGSVAITINKADATINVNGYSGTYDGDAHGATGTATGVKGETLAGLDLGASFANVPGGTADWTFADGTGNYNDDSGSVGILIDKADLTITANDIKKTVQTFLAFAGTEFTAGGLLGSDTVTGATIACSGTPVGAPVGTYVITISDATGTGLSNYNISYVSGTLTVERPVILDQAAQDQLRYKIPYLEQLAPHQINPMDMVSSTDLNGPVYFYHPLTETNASAFDAYTLDVNAYKFIDGSIDIVGHDSLLPILEDARKKGAAAVIVH